MLNTLFYIRNLSDSSTQCKARIKDRLKKYHRKNFDNVDVRFSLFSDHVLIKALEIDGIEK